MWYKYIINSLGLLMDGSQKNALPTGVVANKVRKKEAVYHVQNFQRHNIVPSEDLFVNCGCRFWELSRLQDKGMLMRRRLKKFQ